MAATVNQETLCTDTSQFLRYTVEGKKHDSEEVCTVCYHLGKYICTQKNTHLYINLCLKIHKYLLKDTQEVDNLFACGKALSGECKDDGEKNFHCIPFDF